MYHIYIYISHLLHFNHQDEFTSCKTKNQYFHWILLLLFNCRSFNFLFFSGFHFLISGFLCSFFNRFLFHFSYRDCVLFFITCLLFFRGSLPLLWFSFILSLQQISNILTATLSITKSFCVHYATIYRQCTAFLGILYKAKEVLMWNSWLPSFA